jgi:nucleotide-binding universal stress UspA family protein
MQLNSAIDQIRPVSHHFAGPRSLAPMERRPLRLLCVTDSSRRSDPAKARAVLLSKQLEAELRLLHSADVSTIAAVARQWDADLIVLGAQATRFGESVVGTMAERIIRKAERPILVVNRDVTRPYEHVLLTTDLSEGAAGAARLADTLGLLEGSATSVVHSMSPTGRSMLRVSGVSEPAIETYERRMSRWTSQEVVQQLEQAGLRTELLPILAERSSPFRAIEHAVELTDADLVVVGSSHFPVLKRVVIGSISNEVLRRLTCDVLLVSPRAIKRTRASAKIH